MLNPAGNSACANDFTRVLARVVANEGGYVRLPGPAGGEINLGIAGRDHPELAIEKLTRKGAIAIYFCDFWKGWAYCELPAALAVKLFDLSVSMGPLTRRCVLQRGLRACGSLVVEDGAVGNGTVAAAKSRANSESLLAALRAEAAGYWRPAAAAADFGAGEQGALLERRLEPAYQ